jgi:hypothetical protein
MNRRQTTDTKQALMRQNGRIGIEKNRKLTMPIALPIQNLIGFFIGPILPEIAVCTIIKVFLQFGVMAGIPQGA